MLDVHQGLNNGSLAARIIHVIEESTWTWKTLKPVHVNALKRSFCKKIRLVAGYRCALHFPLSVSYALANGV